MLANDIQQFLPENFRLAAVHRGGVTRAMLEVMEELHCRDEVIVDTIDRFFSPICVDEDHAEFVLLQASWLGLERYFNWSGGRPGVGTPNFPGGIANLRLLVAEAANLLRERGMEATLLRFLELATGTRGYKIESDGRFHFTLTAPGSVRPLADLIKRIVEGERPAHTTYDIEYLQSEQ